MPPEDEELVERPILGGGVQMVDVREELSPAIARVVLQPESWGDLVRNQIQ